MHLSADFKNIVSILKGKIIDWYEAIIGSIPNLIAAFIVLLFFFLISRFIKNFVHKILSKFIKNHTINNLLTSLIYFITIVLGLFISLEILNLEKTVTSILAGAGVIGLALGFAFQEIASNFMSGIFIALRGPYKVGDIVEVDKYFGEITDISLRTTALTTFQGLEVLIPNKFMFTRPFINFTTTPKRRIDLSIGVSYGDDLEKVTRVTKKSLEEIEERIKSKEVEVYFKEFDSSSINLDARIWIRYDHNSNFLKARHKAILNIKKVYEENNITIPFPIRTLDLGQVEETILNKTSTSSSK